MRSELRDNEKIVLETRKHWLLLMKPIFVFLLFLMVTFFVHVKAGTEYKDWQYIHYLENAMTLATVVSLLSILYAYWDYMTNLWIVTDMRVVDEWGVFTRNLKETPLEKINNLSLRQSLLGRIFGFGDIEIQSAAEDGATIYTFVASPGVLIHTISQVKDQKDRIKNDNSRQKVPDTLQNPPRVQDEKNISDLTTCPYCGMSLTGKEQVVEEESASSHKGV